MTFQSEMTSLGGDDQICFFNPEDLTNLDLFRGDIAFISRENFPFNNRNCPGIPIIVLCNEDLEQGVSQISNIIGANLGMESLEPIHIHKDDDEQMQSYLDSIRIQILASSFKSRDSKKHIPNEPAIPDLSSEIVAFFQGSYRPVIQDLILCTNSSVFGNIYFKIIETQSTPCGVVSPETEIDIMDIFSSDDIPLGPLDFSGSITSDSKDKS